MFFLEIRRARVNAMFQAIELVAGRMVYLMALGANSTSRVTFDVNHALTVEIVSEYFDQNSLEVKFEISYDMY